MKAVQTIGIAALLVAFIAAAVATIAPGAKLAKKRRIKSR